MLLFNAVRGSPRLPKAYAPYRALGGRYISCAPSATYRAGRAELSSKVLFLALPSALGAYL